MPLDLIIRGATVVREDGAGSLTIGIENGRIAALAPDLSDKAKTEINASALHIFPGVIDSHVHFNDPGRDHWEGVATGSSALVAGGGTTFFDMPLNASPPTLDAASFDQKLAACRGKSRADFALWGGLTPRNLDCLEELADKGVIGFKAFMSNSGIADFLHCDDLTLHRGMQIAARLNLPVAVHAESESLTSALSRQAIAGGKTSIADYLASRPIVAEVDAIRRAILFAQDTGCSLHIVHISSAAGSQEVVASRHLLRTDRTGPVEVTAETCPHYLLLCDEDMKKLGPPAKCAPPLRPREEAAALLQQVLHGGIDLIASDHSPAPADMKISQNFFEVWGGIAGVQTTLRALLTLDIPLPLIARLLSANVAKRYVLPTKGAIQIGADADLALVDLSQATPLTKEELLDRHKQSPYVGRRLKGRIVRTLLRGQTVFENGATIGPSIGQFLRPTRPNI